MADDVEVNFLRKSVKFENKFIFPAVPDQSLVEKQQIVFILPQPTMLGKTKRQQSFISFEINLSSYNIR